MTAIEESDQSNARDLRADIQGAVTFYHSRSTPGYWFSAGEIEAMVDARARLTLPQRDAAMSIEEEFGHGPAMCPRCGAGSHLFEMRSYLAPEVRMRACHVCHGRWIGHQSLLLLQEHILYRGFFGRIKKMFQARPKAGAGSGPEDRS